MELYFMGTNAGVPSIERNVTSVALRLFEERGSFWLFDCGEATQHQMLQSPLKLSKLEYIFITHLHGDHIFGLPGLISSRSYQGGTTPVTLFGPPGIKKYITASLNVSESRINYPLQIIEHQGGVLLDDQLFRVESALLEHRIASYGYRIVQKDKPGKLDSELLQMRGVRPGPLYGKLKNGESITAPDGSIIHPDDVLGQPKKGKVVTILGDTRPCSATVELAKEADVLVHESTFLDEMADTAHTYYHSTAKQAATAARDAGASRLLLTHFSSRYKYEDQLIAIEQEARQLFTCSELAFEHKVYPV